jgi:hypothetical protein
MSAFGSKSGIEVKGLLRHRTTRHVAAANLDSAPTTVLVLSDMISFSEIGARV